MQRRGFLFTKALFQGDCDSWALFGAAAWPNMFKFQYNFNDLIRVTGRSRIFVGADA
jgi:hypothetical protein